MAPDILDPLAAELAAIAERARDLTDDHEPGLECGLAGETCTGHDAERLIAAVERVLKLAAGWERNSGKVPVLSREAAGVLIQSAISAALLGQDAGKDGTS